MKPLNAVLLENHALTAEELARACSVQTTWVVERVQSGLLGTLTSTMTTTTTTTATAPDTPTADAMSRPLGTAELRFVSLHLRRARRLRAMERDFDANPELAALAVDLIEEVERLRRQLTALGLG